MCCGGGDLVEQRGGHGAEEGGMRGAGFHVQHQALDAVGEDGQGVEGGVEAPDACLLRWGIGDEAGGGRKFAMLGPGQRLPGLRLGVVGNDAAIAGVGDEGLPAIAEGKQQGAGEITRLESAPGGCQGNALAGTLDPDVQGGVVGQAGGVWLAEVPVHGLAEGATGKDGPQPAVGGAAGTVAGDGQQPGGGVAVVVCAGGLRRGRMQRGCGGAGDARRVDHPAGVGVLERLAALAV